MLSVMTAGPVRVPCSFLCLLCLFFFVFCFVLFFFWFVCLFVCLVFIFGNYTEIHMQMH